MVISLADLIFVDTDTNDKFWINSAKQLFIGIVGLFLEDYQLGIIDEKQINISSVKKFQNSSLIKENQNYLQKNVKEPFAEIPFPDEFRIGDVFSMIVYDLDYENLEYGFRFDGEYSPEKGCLFDRNKILLDPYAKLVGGREIWGAVPDKYRDFRYRGRIIPEDFD